MNRCVRKSEPRNTRKTRNRRSHRTLIPRVSRFASAIAAVLGLALWVAIAPAAFGQPRPYIGFVYPAGGQQGTTFRVKLGGQGLDDLNEVFVTGSGVSARVVEFDRTLGAQEVTLLNEQLKALKRSLTNAAPARTNSGPSLKPSEIAIAPSGTNLEQSTALSGETNDAPIKLAARIEKRLAETVNRPASAALASIAYVEVTIDADAPPGARELRLGTLKGVSNPLVFHVGQLAEFCRKPMVTASLQVLGKEELALRKRPASEVEDRVAVPCTLNGQVASGEINRYRFTARKGQRLVITTQARQLIPFIADAVPGWFQPVLTLYDANMKEVAYDDDYRFKPDPTIFYQVPKDGDYVLAIYDAIYRGREDFVYRITVGEIPFVTSLFPLGSPLGVSPVIKMKGWNLKGSVWNLPPTNACPGIYRLTASRAGFISNPLLYALDTLPEILDQEPNNTPAEAQSITLPVIINGRMDRPGDWDVFKFTGKSNENVVAEVYARRLDSPLDSVLKLTDAAGRVQAFNDDHEDAAAGINTHHADSYLMARLPANGTYYVHLGDVARNGGEEYGYRLRISAPQPDFALRVVPSSVSLRSKSTAALSVYVIRKDGFSGPIKLSLREPPAGFSAAPVSLSGTQAVARLTLKTDRVATTEPVNLSVVGSAKIQEREVTHEAVPAEDRMQAFLWRHLVPAAELKALVFDPAYQPPPKRVARVRPSTDVEPRPVLLSTNAVADKPKFSKQQVAGRLRQLKLLYEEGLITDEFNEEKVAECEAVRAN